MGYDCHSAREATLMEMGKLLHWYYTLINHVYKRYRFQSSRKCVWVNAYVTHVSGWYSRAIWYCLCLNPIWTNDSHQNLLFPFGFSSLEEKWCRGSHLRQLVCRKTMKISTCNTGVCYHISAAQTSIILMFLCWLTLRRFHEISEAISNGVIWWKGWNGIISSQKHLVENMPKSIDWS